MLVYISADYSSDDGDRNVVDLLEKWGRDDRHKTDFIDSARVHEGSVSEDPDCRSCDLKAEFNELINKSDYVIIIVGNKTATRSAGSSCQRNDKPWYECSCTPYKQNTNGVKLCKVKTDLYDNDEDIGEVNSYSYIRHEFEQAKKKDKHIIIFYNSTRYESQWLPSYMKEYESSAVPFWIIGDDGNKDGNYAYLKTALGY